MLPADVFKNCGTNVRQITGLTSLRTVLYTRSTSLQYGRRDDISKAIVQLRNTGILCTYSRPNATLLSLNDGSESGSEVIWLFHSADSDPAISLTDLGFELAKDDTFEELYDLDLGGGYETTNGTIVKDELLNAIEATLTHELWQSRAGTKIGSWTWLLHSGPSDDTHGMGVVAKLRPKWKDDGIGTLYISTLTHASSFVVMDVFASSHADAGVAILPKEMLLAPSGQRVSQGAIQGVAEDDSPDAQRLPLASTKWKIAVSSAMAAEGLELGTDEEWVTVFGKSSKTSFVWPAKLCFHASDHEPEANIMSERSWQQYFTAPEGFESDVNLYKDPLAEIEEWFKSGVLSEDSIARIMSPEKDQPMTDVPPSSAPPVPVGNILSPPLLLRPDLQGTNLAYPTPPDGMVPGLSGSQAPTSDSVAATQVPIEPPSQSHGESSSLFRTSSDPIVADEQTGHEDGDQRPRGPSIVSSVGGAQQFGQQNDDLFGDMDQMEFGDEDGEDGDPDFSFFDEPDEMGAPVAVMSSEPPDVVVAKSDVPDSTTELPELPPAERQETELETLHTELNSTNDDLLPKETAQSGLNATSVTPDTVPVEPAQDSVQPPAAPAQETKPLSPFSIREQLLPPPIPASAVPATSGHDASRRRSSFGPLVFNPSSNISQGYQVPEYEPQHKARVPSYEKTRTFASATSARGSLPSTSEMHEGAEVTSKAKEELRERSETPISSSDMDEDDDVSETSMSVDESGDQSSLLTVSKKRKRGYESGSHEPLALSATPLRTRLPSGFRYDGGVHQAEASDAEIDRLIYDVLYSCNQFTHQPGVSKSEDTGRSSGLANVSSSVESSASFSSQDIVMVAQIVAEQAITTTTSVAHEMDAFRLDLPSPTPGTRTAASEILSALLGRLLPSTRSCDATMLVLLREAPNRPAPASSNPAQKAQGQPRPPPARAESTVIAGPDIATLPAPYVRLRRAEDTLELLPTALPFWQALGLAPVSGQKDVRYYCVLPDSEDVEAAADDFLVSLGQAYEGCKLGTHLEPAMTEEADANSHGLGWARTVPLPAGEDAGDYFAVLQSYATVCRELGESLAPCSVLEPGRTIVVYIVNPFAITTMAGDAFSFLCASFYTLFTAYRTALAQLPTSKNSEELQVADIVLQILPIDLICRPNQLVIPTAAQMARIAREVYDRLPPSTRMSGSAISDSSPLPMPAAPCLHLAPTLPKRINFQLAAQPPVDLLHEGSVLHLAYCISPDRKWIAASWIDATGAYSDNAAFALRGQSFVDIVEEIWTRTLLILEARQVGWRVVIARSACQAQSAEMQDWETRCWKTVVSDLTKRKQVTSVTLLAVDTAPDVQFSPSTALHTAGAGFLTPVSTPQPGGATSAAPGFTVSPSADWTPVPAATTAPPTPAPSDTPAVLETDPDTHLVDLQDETYALLLSSSLTSTSSSAADPLASGLLLKRGTPSTQQTFPALGVSLAWTLHVRAGGGVVEGTGRHAEIMLREVLGMWRGLGVLGGFRGSGEGDGGGREGLVPVHVLAAGKAARGVDGLLR